jgi:hypothetical protein
LKVRVRDKARYTIKDGDKEVLDLEEVIFQR